MLQLITSADGSHTLLNTEMNETYHSTKGAVQESLYVFIDAGLKLFSGREAVTIIEVGFGTGLNALLTLQYANAQQQRINYITLEPFPIDQDLTLQLNYPAQIQAPTLAGDFSQMHAQEFGSTHAYGDYFSMNKVKSKLEDFVLPATPVDLVYYDAFAPSKQPEVWSLENMQKCYDSLAVGGVLVSYCASGQFKRNLKAVGFKVETLEGPPGKKEMSRGKK